MAKKIASILKIVLKPIIIVISSIYIAASLTPYINPIDCHIYTFFALGFPYIFLAMLASCLVGLWVFRKYNWVLFLFILFGYKNILSTTGLHPFTSKFSQIKSKGTFRLLSWNVNQFPNSLKKTDSLNSPRRKILNFIKIANADVLCFQDYQDYFNRDEYFNCFYYIKDSLNYPYSYFSIDKAPDKYSYEYYGTIIFSKFPIIDSGRVTYQSDYLPEHIMYTDIEINNNTIRFYNTHLSSMQLTSERKSAGLDYTFIQDDTSILLNKSKLEKISIFDSFHVKQAQIVKQQLNNATKPFVFCADLNSVPSSYVYQHISKGLQDAFLQTGFGWGQTYDGLSNTLRIDVTLLSPQLKVAQYYCPKLKASDHFPLVTDITLP